LKRNLKLIIGAVISVGLLVFLFSRIDLDGLLAAIRKTSPLSVVLAVAVTLTTFYIRAYRWKFLMSPVKRGIRVSSLFSATMIGFMANNVLPARLGEFVRAYAIARKEEIAVTPSFATIVVERLFDGMAVLMLLIATLVFMPADIAGGASGTLRTTGLVSFGAYLAVIAVLVVSVRVPELPGRIINAVMSPFSEKMAGRFRGLADGFVEGLSVIKSPPLMLWILVLSAVHWAMAALPIYILFRGMGIDYGVYAVVLVFTFICLGVALPSTPGFVGTFHAAGVLGLVLLGLDEETALSFAIVAHAANFVPVTLIGLYYLWKENMSLTGLRNLEAVEES